MMHDGQTSFLDGLDGHAGIESQVQVEGLTLYHDLVSISEEMRLMSHIDGHHWDTAMKRRVQHYGYRYDYRARSISADMRTEPLPAWALAVGARLVKRGFLSAMPDQVIVNEYLPGQGISPHVDCVPCFGDTIVSVSLLSTCVMEFTALEGGGHHEISLLPRSAVVLRGAARYAWKHAIPARMQDCVDGTACARARRVSVTFRNAVLAS